MRKVICGIAAISICLGAAPAVFTAIETSRLRECLEARVDATCGSPIFETLGEYVEEPSKENAYEAVELVSAMYLTSAEKLSPSLLVLTESRLADLKGVANDENALCVISASRSFALDKLNLSIGEDVVSAFEAVSGLDKPVTSFVVATVEPGVADFAFNNTAVVALNDWLVVGFIECGTS